MGASSLRTDKVPTRSVESTAGLGNRDHMSRVHGALFDAPRKDDPVTPERFQMSTQKAPVKSVYAGFTAEIGDTFGSRLEQRSLLSEQWRFGLATWVTGVLEEKDGSSVESSRRINQPDSTSTNARGISTEVLKGGSTVAKRTFP